MSRFSPTLCALAALGIFVPAAGAADAPLTQEVHELRRDVQMQAKKIEALSEQILRLTQLVEAAKTSPAPAPEMPVPAPAAVTAIAPPAKPAAAAEPEIPKAEAVPPPVQHTVEKGETLTSIAKHYNIPLPDLQNRNKITNDRKLQIGQTLIIPGVKAPETKAPEAPADKKENP